MLLWTRVSNAVTVAANADGWTVAPCEQQSEQNNESQSTNLQKQSVRVRKARGLSVSCWKYDLALGNERWQPQRFSL